MTSMILNQYGNGRFDTHGTILADLSMVIFLFTANVSWAWAYNVARVDAASLDQYHSIAD